MLEFGPEKDNEAFAVLLPPDVFFRNKLEKIDFLLSRFFRVQVKICCLCSAFFPFGFLSKLAGFDHPLVRKVNENKS